MKKNDADMQRGSGLFIGSEPLDDAAQRSAAGKDKGDDDSTDKGDSDATDKGDKDTTDKGDRGDDSRDADGKD